MFGIGMPEMLLILAIALIVIGPKKLPDLAKTLGRALGEFKRATSDLKESIQAETGLDDVRASFKTVDQELKKSVDLVDTGPDTEATETENPATPDPLASVKKAFDGLNQTTEATAESDADDDAHASDQPPKPQETSPE